MPKDYKMKWGMERENIGKVEDEFNSIYDEGRREKEFDRILLEHEMEKPVKVLKNNGTEKYHDRKEAHQKIGWYMVLRKDLLCAQEEAAVKSGANR